MNNNQLPKKQNTPRQAQRLEYIRKKRIQEKKRRARAFLMIFLSVYIVLMLILGLILVIKLNKKTKAENEEQEYSLSVNKKTFTYDEATHNGKFCITSELLKDLTDITITKDKNTVGLEFCETGEYVNFDLNSLSADINGNKFEMSDAVGYSDDILYLPFEFFENHVLGFIIDINDKEKICTVSRDPTVPPSFVLKKPIGSEVIPSDNVPADGEENFNFITDVSPYESYISPQNRDEFLFLVNSSNTLPENYVPEDLITTSYTRQDGRAAQKLVTSACKALEAFLNEANANGYDDITVTSGYRSYDYQSQLFQNEINITGSAEEAAKNVNPPGSSEHQSGLCVDMHNLSAASTAFGGTPEAIWLEENAHKFGFILRYPEDKTEITGISYEPWHFRFVGRYHATKMYQLDMCLEEYMEYINQ